MIRALFQQIEMHLHKQISTHRLQTALLSPTCLHTAASRYTEIKYTESRYTQSRYTQHPLQHLRSAHRDGAGGERGNSTVSQEATGQNRPLHLDWSRATKKSLSLCAPAEMYHRPEKCHGQMSVKVSEPDS